MRGSRAKGEPCYILRIGPNGREVVEGWREHGISGVTYQGVCYPDELLRAVGGGVYELAPKCELPADGNMRHPGDHSETIEATQLEWCASWAGYDRARRRLNTDSLYKRGDGTGELIRTVALCLVMVFSLYTGFATMGLKGQLGSLEGQLPVLSGQIAKLAGTGRPADNAPNQRDGSLVPDPKQVGVPTGDKP